MQATGRKVWGRAAWTVVGLVAVLAVGGFGAWRYFSHRTGEEAVQLIPSDALFVVTFDTAPGDATQAALFKKIGDALEREGLLTKIDEFVNTSEQMPIVKEVRPYCTKSFAAAFWMKDAKSSNNPDFAILTAVTDVQAVEKALAKYGQAENRVYALKEPQAYATVVGTYLVVGNNAEVVNRVRDTSPGDSVAAMPAYVSARAALPVDANLMFFLSPKALAFAREASGNKGLGVGVDWCAYSISVRQEGLAYDFQVPAEAASNEGLATLAKIVPLDTDMLAKLPAGAYGAVASSQPSAYWPMIQEALKSGAEGEQARKGIQQFESETGLSVEKDVVPAFQGDVVVAVYPDKTRQNVDVVLELTDRNGADPAALADKVRALVEKKSQEGGNKPIRMVSTQRGDATVWSPDEATRTTIMKGMAPYSAPTAGKAPAGQDTNPTADKTVTYAVVGKSVVVASSQAALDEALAARQGKGMTLAKDGAWAEMGASVDPQSQYVMMVDIARIFEVLKPTLEKNLTKGPVTADDVARIFGDGSTGFTAHAKYDGKVWRGRAVLPLDYEKLISVVGKLVESAQGGGKPR